jgi:O-antigen biosynthesis protein
MKPTPEGRGSEAGFATGGARSTLSPSPSHVAGAEPSLRIGMEARVRADGRHLTRAGEPFRVKGVTYGSFRARPDGQLFPGAARIQRDLEHMAGLGLNTIRTYTLPPVELLDAAEELGLYVMVGLHYDDWRMHPETGRAVHQKVLRAGQQAIDEALQRVHGRSNVLALSIGNEVPADLVRLHGIRPVERTLSSLAEQVHAADADLLVTYSNFPTTEYLHIDGLDLTCFNVFLEDPDKLRAYLRHLQIVAGETPLLITELGLASEIHGDEAQAESLDWQLRLVDETGCAGATVFAYTDEWGVADQDVTGWGFGITRADRAPKPAVDVVKGWADRDIKDLRTDWPSLSVVVCAYNEERLITECLDSLTRLDYPNLEVLLCDDGSEDETLSIMRRYPFRVLALPHGGLSRARNAGIAAATGDIVAFLDADAHCHPEWPYHLALSMEDEGVVATGGPNLPVADAGFVERAVAASPGSPVEVLVTDDRAEHVPGCNMAFRKEAIEAVGCFNEVYVSAGDDVDVCWKLMDAGGQIAFSAAAQVRHHRRSTVKAYLKQQRGYGRSERMVSARHPHRFNRLGQARWAGFIYGGLRKLPSVLRPVVYHGPMGIAPYQTVVHRRADYVFGWFAALLPLTVPVAFAGAVLGLVSGWWLTASFLALLVPLLYGAVVASAAHPRRAEVRRFRWRVLVGFLHVAQPYVRAWGRVRAPRVDAAKPAAPNWTGDRLAWLTSLEQSLVRRRCHVRYESAGSPWDISASVGPFLTARVSTAVQWAWSPVSRTRVTPRISRLLMLSVGLWPLTLTVPAGVSVAAAAAVLVAEYTVLRRRLRASLAETSLKALPTHACDAAAA